MPDSLVQLVPQHVRRRFTEPLPVADVAERGGWARVAGEVLQIYDVDAAFSGCGERRHAKRVNGDGRIESDASGITFQHVLDATAGEGIGEESVPAEATCGRDRTEERPCGVAPNSGQVDPCTKPLHR